MDHLAGRSLRQPAGTSVVRLTVSNFRNYGAARLESDGRSVVLFGPNGAGKTNLLEAVSMLTPGRGLRRARLADLQRRDGGGGGAKATASWGVSADIESPSGLVALGSGGAPDSGGTTRRIVRIDGKTARGPVAFAKYLSVAWLTPQMDRLFVDNASGRRRFLDRLVYGFDPNHATRLSAYERALRERARLLRDGNMNQVWLAALETTMASDGVAIAAARRAMAVRLNESASGSQGPFPSVSVAVQGHVEQWLEESPALAVEDRFRAVLAAGRRQDVVAGGAMVGVHRSDFTATHVAKSAPAAQCSTGEQKALLISLVLAHARQLAEERGQAPVLLLDEVAAHLDLARRRAFFDALDVLGGQAWVSGTDVELFEAFGERAQFFRVVDGTITPMNR